MSKLLENLPKAIAAVTLMILLLSIGYETAYFWVLGP
jgi:hypothetical protein